MTTLSQFTGGGSLIPRGRFNGESAPTAFTVGYCNAGLATASSRSSGTKRVLSGAFVANTYKTVLSLAGKGVIDMLQIGGVASSTSTISTRVTIDGVLILEGTYVNSSSNCANIIGAQYYFTPTDNYPTMVDFQTMAFNTSLLIEMKSTLSETDQTYLNYRYYPR